MVFRVSHIVLSVVLVTMVAPAAQATPVAPSNQQGTLDASARLFDLNPNLNFRRIVAQDQATATFNNGPIFAFVDNPSGSQPVVTIAPGTGARSDSNRIEAGGTVGSGGISLYSQVDRERGNRSTTVFQTDPPAIAASSGTLSGTFINSSQSVQDVTLTLSLPSLLIQLSNPDERLLADATGRFDLSLSIDGAITYTMSFFGQSRSNGSTNFVFFSSTPSASEPITPGVIDPFENIGTNLAGCTTTIAVTGLAGGSVTCSRDAEELSFNLGLVGIGQSRAVNLTTSTSVELGVLNRIFSTQFNGNGANGRILIGDEENFVRFNFNATPANAVSEQENLARLSFNATPANAVPEPASLALLGAGLLGVAFANRRRTAR